MHHVPAKAGLTALHVVRRGRQQRLQLPPLLPGRQQAGRLAASHELYTLEQLGEQACRLELVNTVTFNGELRPKALAHETMMMTVSVHNALAKLKLHAEGGIAAVRAVEQDVVVGTGCAAD